MGFDLNKREFRDALHLRCGWPIHDKPAVCVCGDNFGTDYAMMCKMGGGGGLDEIIMRHNLRDLEAELLNMVCKDAYINGTYFTRYYQRGIKSWSKYISRRKARYSSRSSLGKVQLCLFQCEGLSPQCRYVHPT